MNMKFKKDELLKLLKDNRKQHRGIFEEACEGFQEQMLTHLEKMMAMVKRGARVRMHIGLSQPVDQTKEYDRAIRMLEMSVDDEIVLNEGTFANYVMDDWAWTDNFIASNSSYSVGAVAYGKTKSAGDAMDAW